MKIVYFDCFSGISGDMILGALVDVGVNLEYLKSELKKLNLKGYEIKTRKVKRSSILGTKVDVVTTGEEKVERKLDDIEKLIKESKLTNQIKNSSLKIFHRLAEVEGNIHNCGKREIHFHEIGALDSIVDVVGSVIGIHSLEADKIIASPLNVGNGFVNTDHGRLPVPCPATAALLKGYPVYTTDSKIELVTPTGAGIITEFADEFGVLPSMVIENIGYGAGSREIDKQPNLLRIIKGETTPSFQEDIISVIESNVDDLNPEIYGYLMEKLFAEGALDVFFTPIIMKKNRPAVKISVLADRAKVDQLISTIVKETTTFGVRISEVRRKKLGKEIKEISTKYGAVKVKIGKLDGQVVNISPEYEDCRKISLEKGIPLKEVYQEVIMEARKNGVKDSSGIERN